MLSPLLPVLPRLLRGCASVSRVPVCGLSSGRLPGVQRLLLPAVSRSLCGRESWSCRVRGFCPPSRGVSSGGSSGGQSPEGQLIYTGSLATAVRGVKAFSYSTSGAALLLMPQVLLTTGLEAHSWVFQVFFCSVIGAFTLVTPVLLHLLTRGYVVRLYHEAEGDTYTAVTYSVLLQEKRTVFGQQEVQIPAVSRMFTSFYAGRMGLLVNPELFRLPQDYNHLMGYDKPFNFSPDQLD
ncbi:unnamed protein product [Knipowitschia caucasica]|uniref:Transmembrane protein 70 n=1 Tax=Knipowitschia caucasica TaxID=637954 RepID=A0AAV2JT27_KNICA